ncbi:hypothetical protein SOVF_036610 [Spinacia oleracea]|nr:hypothetical protein SOVF_036610 [Spinacia oleracea]
MYDSSFVQPPSNSGFCCPDFVVGSSSSSSSVTNPFDHSRFPTPKSQFVDQFCVGPNVSDSSSSYYRRVNNGVIGGVMVDELGLSRDFQKLNVGNSDVVDNLGFRMSDCSSTNVAENFGVLGSFYNINNNNNGFSGNGGFQSSVYRDEKGVKDSRLGQRGGLNGNLGDSFGSNPGYPASVHGHHNCLINFPLDGMTQVGDDCWGNGGVSPLRGNKYIEPLSVYENGDFQGNVPIPRGGNVGYSDEIPFQMEPGFGPHIVGNGVPLQQYMIDGFTSWVNSQNLSMYNKLGLNEAALLEQYGRQYSEKMRAENLSRKNVLYNSMREKKMRVVEEREVSLMKRTRDLERNSILRDNKGSNNGVIGKSYQLSGRMKNLPSNIEERNFEQLNILFQSVKDCENGSNVVRFDPFVQTLYNSLIEVEGNIYIMAKDQHGCRLLQKMFDEGTFEDVQNIFNEIIHHVVELMMNSFGNYLIQKLLDVCNEEQRMKIIHVVTKDRGELVRVSLNTHGTRVVQKLIESLKTRRQISLVVRSLEPGFLDLTKDINGNHVVQRCLQCLSNDDNKFIFEAAAKFCVEIATHRHGCCVLQRCIEYSSGEHRQKLLHKICSNGLLLAQDPFGNYVVQFIIELKIPSATALLVSQFEGNYVHLSMLKCGSHVVEKCLKFYEDCHARIVYELLSVSNFDQILQDPYANYVVKSALESTKGALQESLLTAARAHSVLRTNPHCKKIFSRVLMKK